MDINTLQKQIDAQNQELQELRKDMMLTDQSPTSMQVSYTPELKSKVFEKAPYYRFLESKGRVQDINTTYAAFYKEDDQSSAVWMDENEDIPAANASSYDEEFSKMKTIIHPIDVSIMAQMGNQAIDLMAREIEKGYIKVTNVLDSTLLQGKGTAASKDFPGFEKSLPSSNVTTMNTGEALSEDIIEDMLVNLVDGNGANIDCIVTTYGVGKLLKKLVAPYRRYNDKIDINLGHRVIGYESITGAEIPILIDANLEADNIMFVDSSTIEVKRLLAPTVFQNIPTNKLGVKNAIVSFVTAQNIGSFRDGLIKGVDTTVDPITSNTTADDSTSTGS